MKLSISYFNPLRTHYRRSFEMFLTLKEHSFIVADLFCKAGGAGMGYYKAFVKRYPDVLIVGVDIENQPNYPSYHNKQYSKNFLFIQADALEFIRVYGELFDLIHASPPCQAYTRMGNIYKDKEYPDLIDITRYVLKETKKYYAIENVIGSPLLEPIMLCGKMFGLKVYRHRLFEINPILLQPYHSLHKDKTPKAGSGKTSPNGFISIAGHFGNIEYGKKAMKIDWMNTEELVQAIPPAYTEWIANQLIDIYF